MDNESKSNGYTNNQSWLESSDLFHTLSNKQKRRKSKPTIADSAIIQEESAEIEESEDFDDILAEDMLSDNVGSDDGDSLFGEMEGVPDDVIALFESAVKESKSQKELEDKWKAIIRKHVALQGEKSAKMKHRLSSLDKVFVDGFQIETNGTYRLNRAAMRRSLRVQWGFGRSIRRTKHRKQRCAGSKRPAFGFAREAASRKYNLKKKTFSQTSFFGRKAEHVTKLSSKDQLQKWLDF